MNDLRDEDRGEQQLVYTGIDPEAMRIVTPLDRLCGMILWLSKQQWPQPEEQTWDGLVAAYDKAMNPDPLPELPSKGYRVGR